MTDSGMDRETEFERRARELFDASVEELDGETRSRLNRARQRALVTAATPWLLRGWSSWAPVGALAACILAAVLLLRMPAGDTGNGAPIAAAPPVEAVDLLGAGEDLDLAAEADLEFYAWIELAGTANNDGNG